jgi:predicted metal-dependent HD superfamily phosphohydrolase
MMDEEWGRLTMALGCPQAVADDVHRVIVASYSDKGRHYHDLRHIQSCLQEFEGVRQQLTDPTAIELAIWFHDLVYVPASACNEDISAAAAYGFTIKMNGSLALAEKVAALIKSTTHDINHTPSGDEQHLLDIDLAVLGYSPALFQRYEEGIRREYDFVAEQVYQDKRRAVLTTFLAKEIIYHTDHFRQKYEHAARKNIFKLLRQWKVG